MLAYETSLWNQNLIHIAGVDEAGRGALAGPVVAATVILHPHTAIEGVQDSKKLGKRVREHTLERIYEKAASIGIGHASPKEIDNINILNASLLAMRRAIESLDHKPQVLLVDGIHAVPDVYCLQQTIVKGDQRSQSIAAASIIAKVTRDRIMEQLHEEHPEYGWDHNAGYPTKGHYSALRKIGTSPHHRQSFRLK